MYISSKTWSRLLFLAIVVLGGIYALVVGFEPRPF